MTTQQQLLQDITLGKMNGEYVWICDFRYENISNSKPMRHVKPCYVLIRDNKELPKTKRIYYSESHFVELKNGQPINSKIHGVFDNTGYRSYSGTPVFISKSEQECRDHYEEQKQTIINNLNAHIETLVTYRDSLTTQE